jgi:hypothetical protein
MSMSGDPRVPPHALPSERLFHDLAPSSHRVRRIVVGAVVVAVVVVVVGWALLLT